MTLYKGKMVWHEAFQGRMNTRKDYFTHDDNDNIALIHLFRQGCEDAGLDARMLGFAFKKVKNEMKKYLEIVNENKKEEKPKTEEPQKKPDRQISISF